jgi:acetyl-CoA synthetase
MTATRDSPGGDWRNGGTRFESARRVVRILDLVGRRGVLTVKALARELGVSMSTCYRLVSILVEEGYLQKASTRGRYGLGPAVAALRVGKPGGDLLEAVLEPIIGELAQRSGRHAYLGLLSDGAVAVSRVESPPGSPPVGVVQGFHGASHALALGKVLIAGSGGASEYVVGFGLEAFTPRTIVRPDLFESHLAAIRARGFATDVEEFAENLCCVAAPIIGEDGEVEGAIGVSTSVGRFAGEARSLVDLVRRASDEASTLLARESRAIAPKDR